MHLKTDHFKIQFVLGLLVENFPPEKISTIFFYFFPLYFPFFSDAERKPSGRKTVKSDHCSSMRPFDQLTHSFHLSHFRRKSIIFLVVIFGNSWHFQDPWNLIWRSDEVGTVRPFG